MLFVALSALLPGLYCCTGALTGGRKEGPGGAVRPELRPDQQLVHQPAEAALGEAALDGGGVGGRRDAHTRLC